MKTAEEWLKENCGSEHQYFSFTDVVRKLEEFAQQNTLNRDKIYRLVNKFYPNWPDKLVKELCSLSLPTLSEKDIEHEAQLTAEIETVKNLYGSDEFEAFKNGYMCAIREHIFGEERVYPNNKLTKPK